MRALSQFEGKLAAKAAAVSRATRFQPTVDGVEMVVETRVDSVQLIHGKTQFQRFELSYGSARQLLGELARWWILQTWCGLRERLLRRALRRALLRAGKTPREVRDATA